MRWRPLSTQAPEAKARSIGFSIPRIVSGIMWRLSFMISTDRPCDSCVWLAVGRPGPRYLGTSFRPANPGVPPRERNVLIVSAVVDVRAVVVTDLQRLMFGDGNRGCGPDARVRLFRFWIWDSVQTGLASVPEKPREQACWSAEYPAP